MGDRDRRWPYYDYEENEYDARDPYRDYGPAWGREREHWREESRARPRDEHSGYGARDSRDSRDYERDDARRSSGWGARRHPGAYGGYEPRFERGRYEPRFDRDWEPEQRARDDRDERERAWERGERPYGFDRTLDRRPRRGFGQEPAWRGTDRYGVPFEESYLQRGYGERDDPYRDEARGPMRGRDEQHWGQQLREAGQRVARKVKRAFRGPKGYKRSDERIREDVNDRLAEQDEFDPSELEVSVSNGDVTLAGSVQSRHDKFLAEEIADDVSGVNEVHNQLRVRRAQSAPSTVFGEPTTSSSTHQNANTEAQRRNARA